MPWRLGRSRAALAPRLQQRRGTAGHGRGIVLRGFLEETGAAPSGRRHGFTPRPPWPPPPGPAGARAEAPGGAGAASYRPACGDRCAPRPLPKGPPHGGGRETLFAPLLWKKGGGGGARDAGARSGPARRPGAGAACSSALAGRRLLAQAQGGSTQRHVARCPPPRPRGGHAGEGEGLSAGADRLGSGR